MSVSAPSIANASNTGAASDKTVVAAPGVGFRLSIETIVITTDAAARLQVTQGGVAGGVFLVDGDYGANSGIALDCEGYSLPENTALKYTTSAGNSKVTTYYRTKSL